MGARAPRSLVTGACGFLGTHMCEVLVQGGHEVRATDRLAALREDDRGRAVFPSVVRGLGIEGAPLDLAAPGAARPLAALLEGVDFVFHLGLVEDPGATFEELRVANVVGSEALARAAARAGVRRLVLVSAAGVYGEPERSSDGTAVVSEEQPPDPPTDLLRTLVAAEQVLMTVGDALDYAILRPGGLYGPRDAGLPGGRWEAQLHRVARWPLAGLPRAMAGRVPLVHARDVCRAALHAAVTGGAGRRVFNVTDDSALSARDYVRLVAALTGNAYLDLPLPAAPVRGTLAGAGLAARALPRLARALRVPAAVGAAGAGHSAALSFLARDVTLDTTRLKATGFELEYPQARRGIRDTLSWYKQEGWLG